MTFAQLTQYSANTDLFAWAYSHAYGGNQRIFDPSFAISKDPDIPAKMRRDPIIDQALRHRQQMVASRKWDVEPGGSSGKAGLKATIVRELIESIRRFDTTRYRLAEAAFRGASYEAVEGGFKTVHLDSDDRARRWWVPMLTKHVDKRMLRQVNVGGRKPPDSATETPQGPMFAPPQVRIAWEMFGTSDRMWHELEPNQSRSLIRHIYDNQMHTLGYGGGLIESLYWYFFAKGIALQEGLQGLERWAQGWVIAKIDGVRKADTDKTNSDRVANAIDKLDAMRSRHVLAHGEDMEIEVKDGGGQGHQIVTAYITYLDSSMTRLILGSLLPSGGGDMTAGSLARGKVEADSTEALIQYDQALMEDTISSDLIGLVCHVNRAVFVEMGLGDTPDPRFVTVREKIEDPKSNIEIVAAALQAGMDVKREQAYLMAGLEIPDETDNVIEASSVSAMAAADGGFPSMLGGQFAKAPETPEVEEPRPDIEQMRRQVAVEGEARARADRLADTVKRLERRIESLVADHARGVSVFLNDTHPAPVVTNEVTIPEAGVPNVTVNVPEQSAPVVNVTVPEQTPPTVEVNVPNQPAPIVNVPKQPTPVVKIPDGAVQVDVNIERGPREKTIEIERDERGNIKGARIEETD